MFQLEGPARLPRHNRMLAAYLSLIAGFVNAVGFLKVGVFTSHVTGNAGRFANDVIARNAPAAINALLLVLVYFLGSFVSSAILQTRFSYVRRANMYALLLTLEAALLVSFLVIVWKSPQDRDVGQGHLWADLQSSVLCFAMGLQNAMVTVISDARVRTTHLTGVVTDLGIEAARWWRFWTGRALAYLPRNSALAPFPAPQAATSLMLLTILTGFLLGAVAGAELYGFVATSALWVPAALLAGAALYTYIMAPRNEA